MISDPSAARPEHVLTPSPRLVSDGVPRASRRKRYVRNTFVSVRGVFHVPSQQITSFLATRCLPCAGSLATRGRLLQLGGHDRRAEVLRELARDHPANDPAAAAINPGPCPPRSRRHASGSVRAGRESEPTWRSVGSR